MLIYLSSLNILVKRKARVLGINALKPVLLCHKILREYD